MELVAILYYPHQYHKSWVALYNFSSQFKLNLFILKVVLILVLPPSGKN